MKLYNFHRSSASYRVRIALALKNIGYEYVPVRLDWDPQRSEHLDGEYAALNPQRIVPMLVDGDLKISQTLAILDYLDRKVPTPPLFPRDDAGRARVLSLSSYICSEIQPLPSLRVERYLHETGLDDEALRNWRQHWIDEGLSRLEENLAHPATGRYGHGDTPTAVDCYLVPQAYNARRAGLDLARWPTIARIVDTCLQHPAFAATVAEHMPDHEPMTRH